MNSSKTKFEFLLTGLSKHLAKINNSSLNTTHSARNLGFIFDEHLTFSDQISSVSKSCYYHICQLAVSVHTSIPKQFSPSPLPLFTTATLFITTCPSLRSPGSNRSRTLFARAAVKVPKSSYITLILRSLHRLKITERTEYKLLSLTYKVLTTTQPSHLHNLITLQPPRSTRSSSLVTLARPSTSSSLRITDRSFQYASPRLWNQLRRPTCNAYLPPLAR